MRSVMIEYWPWLLLAVVFAVGTAVAGPSVGLVSAMLACPVSGAVYLIRAAARRRKQEVASTAAIAHRDAELFDGVGEAGAEAARRYRAVRLPRRGINLSAGVEDGVSGELIRVANASMAIRLAKLLNDENEGKPLPERRPQHVPTRFQLAHDAAAPSPGAAVLYVHHLGARAVAYAPSEQTARRVARLLAHVDYSMDENPALDWSLTPPKAHNFGERLADLPLPLDTQARPTIRPYARRVLGVALWQWLPLIALTVLAVRQFGWPVFALIGAVIALIWLSLRRLRQ